MSPERKIICAIALLASAAIIALPNQATAAVTTDCAAVTTCTLDELVNDGRSIQIGDKTYSDWLIFDRHPSISLPLAPRVGGNATAPDLSLIVVEPNEVDPLHHTLRFDLGGQVVAPGGDISSEVYVPFGYIVRTVDGAARIHDNILELTEYAFPGDGGHVQVAECSATGDFSIEPCLGFKRVFDDNNGFSNLLDSVIYDPALSELFVFTSFAVNSFTGEEGAQLSEFVVEWSQLPVGVPEPGTLALLGLGLLGLGLARRR